MHICFAETLGDKTKFAFFINIDSGLSKLVHLYEPLKLYHGFYYFITSFMNTYGVSNIFNTYKKSKVFEFFNDELSCFVSVHTFVFSAVGIDSSVVVKYVYFRKVVALANFVVVRVMGGCYFNYTSTKFHINIRIRNNGDFLVNNRKNCCFSDKVFISVIIGVNGNGSIAKHCFGTSCSKFKELVCAGDRVFDMPEMSGHINVVYFSVRYCSLAFRAPVYKLFASVNIAFVIKTYKCFKNGL